MCSDILWNKTVKSLLSNIYYSHLRIQYLIYPNSWKTFILPNLCKEWNMTWKYSLALYFS